MKFQSKRNEVHLKDGAVHKIGPRARQEAETLQFLRGQGVAVPKVLRCDENLLVLEHLPGQTLPDLIEHGSYDVHVLSAALRDWFADYYTALPGMLRGDVNGRNFLYDGQLVYSVDFEDPLLPGPPAQDAGRLAAFLASYDTNKPQQQLELAALFAAQFCVQFSCCPNEVAQAYLRELGLMRRRRGTALPKFDYTFVVEHLEQCH